MMNEEYIKRLDFDSDTFEAMKNGHEFHSPENDWKHD